MLCIQYWLTVLCGRQAPQSGFSFLQFEHCIFDAGICCYSSFLARVVVTWCTVVCVACEGVEGWLLLVVFANDTEALICFAWKDFRPISHISSCSSPFVLATFRNTLVGKALQGYTCAETLQHYSILSLHAKRCQKLFPHRRHFICLSKVKEFDKILGFNTHRCSIQTVLSLVLTQIF